MIKLNSQLPAQAAKNYDNQLMFINEFVPASLVTVNKLICTPFPAKEFIYIIWFFVAVSGSIFNWDNLSDSLKERKYFKSNEIKKLTVMFHEKMYFRP
jgi:hypothetical protein